MRRIPSLDGLRAISILMVIIAHAAHGIGADETTRPLPRFLLNAFGNGGLGVEVFFVISGFLITSLLLEEHRLAGQISLAQFYIRRTFRIIPAFYAYLLVVLGLTLSTHLEVSAGDFLRAASFTWNYSATASAWALGHTWSLAVEEQFYLLWPLALRWALRTGTPRRAIQLSITLIALSPLMRLGTWAIGHPEYSHRLISFMLHTRVDALMFGCLLALSWGSPALERIFSVADRLILLFPAMLVASPYLTQAFGGAYLYVFGYTIEGVSITLLTAFVVRHPSGLVGRLLNTPAVVRIGVLSYSLYLWQEIFLDRQNQLFVGLFPLGIFAICGCAWLSHTYVEKVFLRLRGRIFGAGA